MVKTLTWLVIILGLMLSPLAAVPAHAAAGIFSSGGGNFVVGEKFSVTVTASGTTFDSLQGTISVSGPVDVVSFSPGSATWLPGKSPGNGQQFVGITSATGSLTVAKITLKGNKEGSGSVNVSGVKLASKGQVVATDAGGASFKIGRAPVLPGTVNVTSPSHPNQNEFYENPTVELQWEKSAGVTDFSYVFDQNPSTTPATNQPDGPGTSAKFENQAIGTYYFHIRAKNGDGWGGTTHFKVNIKEPDPKINDTLTIPTIKKMSKLPTFATDLENGTASGIRLTGTGEPNYTMNVKFSPSLGEAGELASVAADATGAWTVDLEKPVKVGFYTVTVQGQQEKVLTPVSEPKKFEVSIADGGKIGFIDQHDAVPSPVPTPSPTKSAVQGSRIANLNLIWPLAVALGGTGLVAGIVQWRKRRKS